jgi:hypothetical protein
MDPKKYEDRAKFKSIPLDFQYQDAVDYESNYEYLKEKFCNYHFDKWKEDPEGEYFNLLGRFEWTEEQRKSVEELLPWLEQESKNVGWNELTTKQAHPGFPGGISPMHGQEEYDRDKFGGIEFTQVVPEPKITDIPVLKQMADYWKLKRCRTRIHTQMPGQTFPMHIDKLWHRYPAAPHKLTRMIIHLQDYEPGQLMQYGNYVHTGWKAGDIHIFDTLNVPHGTVNMSRVPRTIFVLTAVRTDETDEILRSCSKDSIHRIGDK